MSGSSSSGTGPNCEIDVKGGRTRAGSRRWRRVGVVLVEVPVVLVEVPVIPVVRVVPMGGEQRLVKQFIARRRQKVDRHATLQVPKALTETAPMPYDFPRR
jgi:hypothetical protein